MIQNEKKKLKKRKSRPPSTSTRRNSGRVRYALMIHSYCSCCNIMVYAAGLSTDEINSHLKRDTVARLSFVGTFPSDRKPPILKLPCCFVWNTAPSSSPGEHWVACYIDENFRAWYFDSAGETIPDEFKKVLTQFVIIRVLTKPVQHIMSTLCGQYSIMFLILACRGINPNRMIKTLFSNNLSHNDLLVEKWFARYTMLRPYK